MRIALCDDDDLLLTLVESMVSERGHEIVGVVDTTPAAVALIEAARPDAVIAELAMGFNTDFDIVEAAVGVGAVTIAFTSEADDARLAAYRVRPFIVPKPDLVALEEALERLVAGELVEQQGDVDRRQRPSRAAVGPVPTGVADAQAFYEALNEAAEGDALVSIDVVERGTTTGELMAELMRETDRLLASPESVKVFLVGGGDVGIASLLARLREAGTLSDGTPTHSIVLRAGESPAEAFDRLKQA